MEEQKNNPHREAVQHHEEREDYPDINSEKSKKRGFSGIVENLFRQFKSFFFLLFLLPIAFLYVFCLGVATSPMMYLLLKAWNFTLYDDLWIRALFLGFALGTGVILFIVALIIVVPIVNAPFIPFVRSYRGPWFSIESMAWYYHNALTYLVRYTILDFITPSPLNIFFFRAMGMKIGKNVLINSSNISDPCLIVLEDNVTIGGSAFMMAHYGMKGFLIIDKLHMKKGAMVGLMAKILGGVTVGKKAVIGPNAMVLPKTIIKDGEKFGIN
jgi:hypothetical protein